MRVRHILFGVALFVLPAGYSQTPGPLTIEERLASLESQLVSLESQLATLDTRLNTRTTVGLGSVGADDASRAARIRIDALEREVSGLTREVRDLGRQVSAAQREASAARREASTALSRIR